MSTHVASASTVVPASPGTVLPRLLAHDPVRFYPRSGILPAVVEVRDPSGPWDAPGRTRTLVLSDGGTVVETIRSAGLPLFAYDLTRFTGLFGALVAHARSEWRVTPAGDGSTIAWTYAFTARPGRGILVGPIVRLAWGPYMRKVLPAIAAFTAA